MNLTRKIAHLAAIVATYLFCVVSSASAQRLPIVAGQNGTGPGEHLTVPFTHTDLIGTADVGPLGGHWEVGTAVNPIPLIADPSAPPMDKWFMTPSGICDPSFNCECFPNSICEPPDLTAAGSIGGSAILEPGWGAPVWENFLVYPGDSTFPESPAITDWHEHIHEPGWEWVVPQPGATNPSLITRDGEPWPWEFIDPPAGTTRDPSALWVKFPPIGPGHILDIHKELVWRGTPDNTFWGDQVLDNGEPYEEYMVSVWEYPTIPEPSTLVLGALASLGLTVLQRQRWRTFN